MEETHKRTVHQIYMKYGVIHLVSLDVWIELKISWQVNKEQKGRDERENPHLHSHDWKTSSFVQWSSECATSQELQVTHQVVFHL